jgi:putative oxidoreductase
MATDSQAERNIASFLAIASRLSGAQGEAISVETSSRYISFVGRVLLSAIFIMSGAQKLGAHEATVQYIASSGMPMPSLAYFGAIVFELGGGLALLVGFQARIAAIALSIFTVLAAAYFHTNFADQIQMIMFLKNFTIVGGLLMVVANGAGGFALDNRKA